MKKNGSRDADDRLQDLPDWLEEFTDNLGGHTNARVPSHVSQDSDSERATKEAERPRKHSIFTHFTEDRNCEVCLRTKITKPPCRRRTGEAVLRAEKFGDPITVDHKVLNEESESTKNHRHAVVVQDLATQWISLIHEKTKTSQQTEESLKKFLEPYQKPGGMYTGNSLEFGENLVKIHRGITERLHFIDSRPTELPKRAVRRVKEGTSAALLQSGSDEKGGLIKTSQETEKSLRKFLEPTEKP